MTNISTRSLLVGASGQIGTQILHLLGPERCLVTSRHPASPAELELDLATIATPTDAQRLLEPHSLDAIYCIAAMTHVDGCEDAPEQAFNINCRGPEMLAHVAHRRNIPFIFFSTEYVFDGHHGPYAEDSIANPLSIYGRSKWQGELAVLAACSHALILRTTVVFGRDSGKKNYIYSLVRTLAANQQMRVPEDQVSTPTYNRDLALATIGLAQRRATGIFHVCGPERMNRLEFATTVARYLSLDPTLLQGVPTAALNQKALRPLSAGLSIDKLRSLHPSLTMRPLNAALADCADDLQAFARTSAMPA